MSLDDGSNVVHLKRPATVADFFAKPAGLATGGDASSGCGTVIRFPDRHPAATRIGRAPRHTIHRSPIPSAIPIASADSLTGWPVRVIHSGDPGTPAEAISSERQAAERSPDEGAPLGAE